MMLERSDNGPAFDAIDLLPGAPFRIHWGGIS
jgi:hypothetical protein